MKNTKFYSRLAFCLLLTFSIYSSEEVDIDAQSIKNFAAELSSDRMEGRKSGESSGYEAERSIARIFKTLGLEPGGKNGTYFQEFTYPMMRFLDVGMMRLTDRSSIKNYTYGDDYYFYSVTSSGHARTEVIFVGYGISRPDLGWDDYENLNVDGKILICFKGAPDDDKSKWGRDWTDYSKADLAINKKALALLVFDPEQQEATLPRYRIWSFNLKRLKRGLIFGTVGKKVVRDIFLGTGKNLSNLKQTMDNELKTQSFSTEKVLELEASTLIDTRRQASNVIGKIPGVHPRLKEEVVIISGHYDGGGSDPDGIIYNGANDNASGISVMLEIARIMKAKRVQPSRSILFIGWGAEEQGGFGSQYFIEHPVVSIDKIASAFVLDCVGLGKGEFWLFGADHFVKEFADIKDNINPSLLQGFHPRKEAGSDQYYFQQKEIPSFFVHNIHKTPVGHTPQDVVTNLNAPSLDKAARLVYHAALFTASKNFQKHK